MSTTGLGIAALVLGAITFTFAFVPIIGLFGIPFAALGALLGIAGMITVGLGHRTGMPIAAIGTGLCVLSILLAFFTTNNRASVRNQRPQGPPPPPPIDMTHTTGPYVPKLPDLNRKQEDFNSRIEEIKRQANQDRPESK